MTVTSFNINQQLTSVRLATDSNLTGVYYNGQLNNGIGSTLTALSYGQLIIDTVTANIGDRVLLIGQTNSNENGIYVVSQSGAMFEYWKLERSTDFQSLEQIVAGQYLSVNAGTNLAGNMFIVVEPLPTAIGIGTFNFFNVTGSSSGGPFLTVEGNLSDLGNRLEAYQNFGFGSGGFLFLDDSDFVGGKYQLTNPAPNFVTVLINTPGLTLILPQANQGQSFNLFQGIFLESGFSSSEELAVESFGTMSPFVDLPARGAFKFYLLDNSTPQGNWLTSPVVESVNGKTGTVFTVVQSWDGSTDPIDVTAGTGIDITDGIISLTGAGASAGYGYLTRQNISFSSISFVDSTNYFIPLIGNVTPDINQCNNFTPFLDGSSHLGIKYTGSESGVAEITFQLGVAYSPSNTNTNPNNYMLSANLNLTAGPSGSFAPINIISGNNSGSNIPFTVSPSTTTTVTITFQVPMNPNDVFYPNIRNNGPSNSPSLNAIVINTYSIIAEKVGDIGGTSAGVSSLNGLTGNLDLISSDSTISFVPSGTNIDLSVGVVGINHGGTNSTSSNFYSISGKDGIVFYDSTRLKSNSEFTYDPTQGIMAINSSSANPGIAVSSTFGSTNVAFLSASRASSSNGEAQYRLLSGSTNEWTWGTFAGGQDLLFTSHNGGNNILTMSYSDNSVTINSGNLTLPLLTSNSLSVTDNSKNLSSLTQGILGQVLTSNGPGLLPSWSGSSPPPAATYAFSAHLAGALANSTGDGTLVSVTCDSVDFDIGSNYSGITGLFTAPANGIYSFGCSVFLSNLSASHTQYLMYIIAGGTTYMMSQGNPANERSTVSNQMTRRGTVLVQLTAGQTVHLQVEVDGTAKTVTIGDGGQPTSFFGAFISSTGISIPGTAGFSNFVTNSSTSVSAMIGTFYYNNSSSTATYTLPTATGSNKSIAITGLNTAGGGWIAAVQSGDSIQLNSNTGTTSASSTANTNAIFMVDVAPNLWVIYDSSGLINII